MSEPGNNDGTEGTEGREIGGSEKAGEGLPAGRESVSCPVRLLNVPLTV